MRVVQHKTSEPRGGLSLTRFHEGIPTDEVALVQLDGESEAGFVRVYLGPDVGAPHAVSLLEPHRIHGLVATGGQRVTAARLPDRVPQTEAELGRTVQLPAELADVRDPEREA